MNPSGIREFGYIKSDSKTVGWPVAIAYWWGPRMPDYYVSDDSGASWKIHDVISYYDNPNFVSHEEAITDCAISCTFPDILNSNIQYRITNRKEVEISYDNETSWQTILSIPAWTNLEKNYINISYDTNTGPVQIDIRGPFDVITDPKTGNILVAMGLEGVLLQVPGKNWQWIQIDKYKQIITPSSPEMIKLIPEELWFKGIFIALLTFLLGTYFISKRRLDWTMRLFILYVLWVILITPELNKILFELPNLFTQTYSRFDNFLVKSEKYFPFVIMAVILLLGLINLIRLKSFDKKQILLLIVSSLAALIWFDAFLLFWSLGFIGSYHFASVLAEISWLMILALAHSILKKKLIQNVSQ